MVTDSTAEMVETSDEAGLIGEMESQPELHPVMDRIQLLRIVEALLFASAEPVAVEALAKALPPGTDVLDLILELRQAYETRGVNLAQVSGKWTFRTAEDLSYLLRRDSLEQKRLSKAALETLAIIAYHQPVTRAEIEDIRGVAISKGTIDQLMEIGWVRLRGRRKTPGKPVTYGTTEDFLAHFGLNEVSDLPGMLELKGAGLLDANLPPDFSVPSPSNEAGLLPDEEPLEEGDEQMALEMDMPEPGEVDAVIAAAEPEAGDGDILPELPEPEDDEPLPPLGAEDERD